MKKVYHHQILIDSIANETWEKLNAFSVSSIEYSSLGEYAIFFLVNGNVELWSIHSIPILLQCLVLPDNASNIVSLKEFVPAQAILSINNIFLCCFFTSSIVDDNVGGYFTICVVWNVQTASISQVLL